MMNGLATFTHVITRLDRVTQYCVAPAMESQRHRVLGPRVRGDDDCARFTFIGKHI
jgi:hypothetical protein